MSRLAFGGMGEGSGYTFAKLPETEAAVGVDDMVWEFVGAANTNETAVCGTNVGLTGADLVATQNGGIGAAADGGRPITDESDEYFVATLAFWQKFLMNSAGFSMLWHSKNHGTSRIDTSYRAMSMVRFKKSGGSSGTFFESLLNDTYGIQGIGWHLLTAECACRTSNFNDFFPATGHCWILMSHDPVNAISFAGIANTENQPTKIADFSIFTLGYPENMSAASADDVYQFYDAQRVALIGGGTKYVALGRTICSVTAKLGPCVFKD